MRTEDLNNDGESDCVGLHVQDLRIITDPRISVESLGKDLFRNGRNNSFYQKRWNPGAWMWA